MTDFYGPVRPRFWLTVPVDAGVEGRTPLGQGRRAWDWVSGRDKDSDNSIQHYATMARKIVQALPNDFNIRAATPAQILWYRRHRTMLGVIHEPIPPAGVGPAALSAQDFPRTAFDEGGNAERPWWRPSFAPLVRVYDPDNPAQPASYQTFLTVEHFPESGLAFPRAAYLNALLNVNTQASIEWTQHINIRTPDDAKAVNYRNTKNIQDQMRQRGKRGAESEGATAGSASARALAANMAMGMRRVISGFNTVTRRLSRPEVRYSLAAPQFLRRALDLLIVSRSRNPGQLQRIIAVAGDHVHVEVENALPRRGAAGVEEVHALCSEPLDRQPGQPPGGLDGRLQVLRRDLQQVAAVRARDHERVPAGRGCDVHEGQRALVLGDDARGQLARDDLAEDAVGSAHRSREH